MDINIKKLAQQLMFDYDEKQKIEIENEINNFKKYLSILDKIDTTDVEEMIYPIDIETSYLRNDEANHFLNNEELFKNADKIIENHLTVPKVVG